MDGLWDELFFCIYITVQFTVNQKVKEKFTVNVLYFNRVSPLYPHKHTLYNTCWDVWTAASIISSTTSLIIICFSLVSFIIKSIWALNKSLLKICYLTTEEGDIRKNFAGKQSFKIPLFYSKLVITGIQTLHQKF